MELEKIIMENMDLIYKIASYFTNYAYKQDLIQAGVIGMIKAYRKYDDSYNTKFTTYAYDYIVGEMKKHIREDKGIKVSRDIKSLYNKIEQARVLLEQRLHKNPTIKELSDFLSISEEELSYAINSSNNIDSLDMAIKSDSKDLSLYDVIPDKVDDIDSLIDLRNSLNKLNSFERKLIESRYIFDLSQQQTASKLGISQVQVSRNEKKIMMKLKTIMQ